MYAGYCVPDLEGGFIFASGSVLLTRPIKRKMFVRMSKDSHVRNLKIDILEKIKWDSDVPI
jgi:hypothetical protein